MNTLKQAKVGQTVTVARLNGQGAVKRRIMTWGSPGARKFISARLRLWETRLS